MDYLIKQSRRVKFATHQDAEGSGSNKERRTLPQKTPSLREEKNRPQNWFGRQIPWQMNQAYDSNEVEKATAVAAATYAVISVTDSTVPDKKTLVEHSKPSFTPTKSQKESPKVSTSSPQPAADIRKIDDTKRSSLRKESLEIEEEKDAETSVRVAVGTSPSVTRTPTVTDKPKVQKVPTFAVADDQLRTRKQIQPSESLKKKADPVPEIKIPKPDIPSAPIPALSPAKMNRQASAKTSGGTEADSWERAELAKIKKRYEEVEARVVSWENEKKTKSRRRLDKTERELERKRLKALDRFRSEIEDINQIVDGARSKAKERRRHDELKAKEKANTYRKTGQPPTTCFCF